MIPGWKTAVAEAEGIAENPLFKEAAGARVLVTGVSGMVGSCLALAFLAADARFGMGLEVFGMARDAGKIRDLFAGTPLKPLAGDVADPIRETLRFDYIVHAASPVGPALFASHPAQVARANLAGTISLLDKARRDRSRRFLFVSTHEVYGSGREVWREEDAGALDFLDPRSCYPESKRAGENACVCYHREYGLHTGVARLSRLYGPAMNLASGLFVCDFVKDVLAGRPVAVKGGPGLLRPLCHMADAADGLIRILFSGAAGAAYNLGPDEAWTIGEIARELAGLGGVEAILPEGGPSGGPRQDNTRLKGLGWSPKIGIRKGLRRVVEALR